MALGAALGILLGDADGPLEGAELAHANVHAG